MTPGMNDSKKPDMLFDINELYKHKLIDIIEIIMVGNIYTIRFFISVKEQ